MGAAAPLPSIAVLKAKWHPAKGRKRFISTRHMRRKMPAVESSEVMVSEPRWSGAAEPHARMYMAVLRRILALQPSPPYARIIIVGKIEILETLRGVCSLPHSSSRSFSAQPPAAFPHSSRSFSAQVPHSFRTAPAAFPHSSRPHSSRTAHSSRTTSVQLPHNSRTAIPQLCVPLW